MDTPAIPRSSEIKSDLSNPSVLTSLSKQDAQDALDRVWQVLDSAHELHGLGVLTASNQSRQDALKLATKLATSHTILPTSLLLVGVKTVDADYCEEGGFASIYYGEVAHRTVAIKRLKVFTGTPDHLREKLKQAFYRECILWKNLNHPHVLPLLGVAEDVFHNAVCIILPWATHGRIRNYIWGLYQEGKLVGGRLINSIVKGLTQIALGLEYLHSEGIVHGDLHGGNVLVDAGGNACLTDFGMAVIADATAYQYGSIHGGGAVRWTAPELIEPEEFGMHARRPTFASDIYSLACVCIELFTGKFPFEELERDYQVIVTVMKQGRPMRPRLPDDTTIPDEMWSWIARCWAHNPSQRPAIDVVARVFEVIPNAPGEDPMTILGKLSGIVDHRLLTIQPKDRTPGEHLILCNECGQSINGVRYQCASCPSLPQSFSLCENCKLRSYILHDAHHIFFKLPRPVDHLISLRRPALPNLYSRPAGPMEGRVSREGRVIRDPREYLSTLEHRYSLCDMCMSKIKGEWFRCVYCSRDLCSDCEKTDVHDKKHFFLVLESEVDMNDFRQFFRIDSRFEDIPVPILTFPVYD
ncbi:hypothetical protein EIP91_008629 [Steccherinum ochraceum]|uniref:Protein kinase domain-containing protein n=1 Tax=Steccherinum ochraceum TaxID=92696 RepID=A0A4R0RPQ1_9APHY|nr:hypothetical protein EIP91_008629 [Steccherinum ochraceum]